jgi:hypothetical protein
VRPEGLGKFKISPHRVKENEKVIEERRKERKNETKDDGRKEGRNDRIN